MFKRIITEHRRWLRGEQGAKQAYLKSEDLYGCDLSYVDLRKAIILNCNLSNSCLFGADLRGADLRGSKLLYTDLSCANLSNADLCGADLRNSDLTFTILDGADLGGADLTETCLITAQLEGARNLDKAKGTALVCPEKGSFIGYKKAYTRNRIPCVVRLLIPDDAKRSSATTRKCRCSKAKVLSISDLTMFGGKRIQEARSRYDVTFIYKVGETVVVDDFDENRWNECAPGIHFFMTQKEAIEY